MHRPGLLSNPPKGSSDTGRLVDARQIRSRPSSEVRIHVDVVWAKRLLDSLVALRLWESCPATATASWAGGNPSGLDKQYAHKMSLVYLPKTDTLYLYYCACGNKGRGIGLITSKPLAL